MSAKPSNPGIKWPLPLIERVGEMWESGCSARVIAKEFGVTRSQVLGLIWHNGYERPGSKERAA